ncbi:DUF6095 family protein [Abyssalbus ytuae]|uniref:DUF6095 family protein n=1 Tax=Abyssalbus ytuae TaxID=2926907 RepID=A0A9E7CTZ4_9FLAO|nr:DUF6095 family protein [Abyssalbus ytuae]UOB17202.1 DUF6095 family protein [Abyssalbus ytuae]
MKRTNKTLLFKSFKYFSITALLMFIAPFIIWQAFKNQDHPFYLPVLIIGIITAILAIVMGFYSLKIILKSIFGDK